MDDVDRREVWPGGGAIKRQLRANHGEAGRLEKPPAVEQAMNLTKTDA